MDGLIGRHLNGGEYELRGVIAQGGQATVYRAYSRTRDADVAVKVLSPRLARSAEFRARFLAEYRSLAHLHHENIIELYDYLVEDDLVYIVMRLVPGGTLKGRMGLLDGPLDPTTAARLIGQVAGGLEAAHDAGYVHLDIKPANILLGRADWPLLTDFGITRAIGREQTAGGRERLAGTPLYMSPEQCQGGPIDGRSDQYSLAVTAYELLTRQLPFHSTTTEGLLEQHLYQPPPRPREYNPGLPEPVEAVLLRGLAKDPADRYPTVREFGEALGLAVEQTRGVSLETKAAVAAVAPVVLGVSAALLAAPLLLATIPSGARLEAVPLAWPFALLIRLLVLLGLFRVRWTFRGLAARAMGAAANLALIRGEAGTRLRWRSGAAALGEGIVDLAYLWIGGTLLAAPLAGLAARLVGDRAAGAFGLLLLVLLVAFGLGVVVRSARLGGAFVALGLAGLLLVEAVALAPTLLGPNGVGAIPDAGAVVAALLLLALALPLRRGVGRIAVGSIVPLLVEARQVTRADERDALERRLRAVSGATVDLALGVLILLLLQTPLAGILTGALGPPGAEVAVTALLVLIWLVLVVRLALVAGRSGAALGLLLGAPLLRALPLGALLPVDASALVTLEVWCAAVVGCLALVLLRGTLRGIGEAALGARVERGLTGPLALAPGEDAGERRVRAGRILIGALLDVILLGVADWVVGPPLADLLARDAAPAWLGAALQVALVLVAGLILAGAIRETRAILAATGAEPEATRLGLAPAVVALLATLLVGGFGTIPTAVAAPAIVDLGPTLPGPPQLVVSWQFWRPDTPRVSQATYDLALSCSDGTWLGDFREAVDRPTGAPMPLGSIGSAGPALACDDWRVGYRALRDAAGVTSATSLSRDWLDQRIVLGADGTAAVTATHRVLFTAGRYDHLDWAITLPPGADLADLELSEGAVVYPVVNPPGAPAPDGYALQVSGSGSQRHLVWSFPPVSSPDQRTYTLRYRLLHVAPADGAYRFEVAPAGEHGPVWFASASVDLPSSLPGDALQLDSGRVPSRHQVVNGHTAWFEAQDLASDVGWTVVLRLPSAPSPPGPAPTPLPSGTPIVAAPLVEDSPTTSPTSTPTPTPAALPAGSGTPTPAPAKPKPVASSATPSPSATSPAASPTIGRVATLTNTPTVAGASVTATATPTSIAATATPTPLVATATATSVVVTTTATPLGSCSGDERMAFSPANPVAGQTITIAVTASRDLGDVRLQGPDNPQGPAKHDFAGGTEWDWQVTPGSPGRLDYYFFVESPTSTLCTTNGLVVAAAPATPTRPPTNTPVPTKTPVPPSATPTPKPPTNTPTATPAPPTFTPIPPTATSTATPRPPTDTPTPTRAPTFTDTPRARPPTPTPTPTFFPQIR